MTHKQVTIKYKPEFVAKNLLVKSEAYKSLRVSVQALNRLIESHGIQTIRITGTNRTWVDRSAIESLIARSTGGHA